MAALSGPARYAVTRSGWAVAADARKAKLMGICGPTLRLFMSLLRRILRWTYSLAIRRRRSSTPKQQQVEEFFHALQRRAWSHALTIRIAKIENDEEVTFSSASGFLIQFENGRALAGTAWHVLEEFRNARKRGETVGLVLDNMPVSEPQVVFHDESRDIGFIEVPPRGREGISAVPYRPKRLWPPPRVVEHDDLLLCGFPKLLRFDGEEILHGDLNLLLPVVGVSDNVIHLEVDWDSLVQAWVPEYRRSSSVARG